MGRYLKIAVYVAGLFLAYLWIATIVKAYNKNAETASNENTEIQDDFANVASDEFEDDLFEEEGADYDETAVTDGMGGGTVSEDNAGGIDYTEVDEIIEKNTTPPTPTKPVVSKSTTTTATAAPSSNSGKYMLLAGSYLIEDNALAMVKKLRKLGYSNAEVVVFDMSQYHSVCAGRYTSLSSAQQESGSLRRKGIDNYVHRKQ